ncbi:right-handed parallel beta-helix repeat-containing protein [Candidatus Nitrotoga sp. 1052]|uniref:right-handed parallel beta-helix repeat-containing protein n=1 Tax=Candidatus Nitrotoga sp. 1052 TaxID=2886964 RepID=UPI001EF5A6BF|nr:right-handed parallel beta-helix repeat-containing protein [Candidatus Nitrotoga sp. 1052]CAH1091445.1 conserved exported hypothetical protein [Candidatus Nitrotoga sp. 1052]
MNNRNLRFQGLVSFVALQFFVSSAAYALPTQTWVSGFGSDSGACSFIAPCKTLAFALTQTAAGGEISIDSPGELGVVTINKGITINAVGALGSIVAPSGVNAITIAAGASDVVILRGLTIDGADVGTNGIVFTTGGKLYVENCMISRFTGIGLSFTPSAASALFVNNVSFKNNAYGGAVVTPGASGSATASFNNTKAEGNFRGIVVTDGTTAIIRNSIVTGTTTGAGFAANSNGGRNVTLTIESSVASGNTSTTGANGAIQAVGANAVVRMSNVTVTSNTQGLFLSAGGSIISFGNNRISGNINSEVLPTQTVVQN